jgi:DNA-binding NarL/FixJ family response regulator
LPVETLIIDDSDTFRRILRARLESIGCEIVGEAYSAAEGLELFRAHRPRLVTLDLIMPESEKMDADALFLAVRKESPETAIVVISANRRDLNASHFLAAGAIAYLDKSFMNFDRMTDTLKRVFPELGQS